MDLDRFLDLALDLATLRERGALRDFRIRDLEEGCVIEVGLAGGRRLREAADTRERACAAMVRALGALSSPARPAPVGGGPGGRRDRPGAP
jgi:hypothetical protein